MSDQTTYQRLAERFAASSHKTRKQGGADLTYVTGEMVISRLNEVLGFDWSFRIVREGQTDIEAWVLGELVATIDGKEVSRQHYGNQELTRGSRSTSDLYKSAATDALKKCATTLGIALYLYDEDERREVEAEMRAEKRNGTPKPATSAPAQAAAVATGVDPTPLKTKVELVADLQKGLEYARSLGLDPAEQDPTRMNRADIENVIEALRSQCRAALAERKQQTAS
jgi:recombination DNA repair RAD52 pathway protein